MTSETSHTEPLQAACDSLDGLYDDTDVDACVTALRDRRPDDAAVSTQAAVFGALANEHRLRALAALREGELCACELQVVLDAPQSTVATHLRTLREAGLVRTRKKGRWTYYRIADTAATELLDLAASIDTGDSE
ncbi:ArsR/SmtB family transcription factor [Halovivax gelatinilyticus]|uniref:ArsR/SmtB family transcription factor n=1 Tax=Halovivax gelatinilyticus TaxID=2961597 RepID=UPI0020CA39C6|nr:metalloregulator ArsR/SmtB family transcription factor [Halovivax gelatinilyticus]